MNKGARLLTPSKINLFLYVLRKRKDGYHELFTSFLKVSLFDEVLIYCNKEGNRTISLEVCSDCNLSSGKDNLCYKAAKEFLYVFKKDWDIKIRLKKNIPIGAGLGGGSSDAAATIRILMTFLSDAERLRCGEKIFDLGRRLGADVPFFLYDEVFCIARGIGDEIISKKAPEFYFVLINPNFSVDTAWVYKNLRLTIPKDDTIFADDQNLERFLWHNDLEDIVIESYPEIAYIKKLFLEKGALASMMSGSGSSVFGVFRSKEEAFKVKQEIEKSHKDFKIYIVTGTAQPKIEFL